MLDFAQLQGASLPEAQLQGASLIGAEVRATNFSRAFLWRTQWGEIDPKRLGAIQLKDATWKPIFLPKAYVFDPIEWTGKAYAELRNSINSIPEGEMREAALGRINTLDCGNPDKSLASCRSAANPPREVKTWQNRLAGASGGDAAAYAKALATELQSLVCANDDNAIDILRGIISRGIITRRNVSHGIIWRGIISGGITSSETFVGGRLRETNREAPRLVDFIMSKNCPVSTALTDDDKGKLLKIKQDAEQKSAPPKASMEEK